MRFLQNRLTILGGAALAMATATGTAQAVIYLETGPGGTYNAYQFDATGRTWQDANTNAQSQFFSPGQGAPAVGGNLIAISSALEARIPTGSIGELGGNYWIGLNDIANEANGSVSQARNAGLAGTGTNGWVNSGGEPFVYHNWNGGEPNNAGNEDAIEALANGLYNDLPDNNAGFLRASIIEYQTAISDTKKIDGFKVTVAKAYNNIQNMTIAESVIAGAIPSVQTQQAVSFMNFQENGNDGNHFGGGLQVPGIVGDQSNYVSRTTADLNVTSSNYYTFGFTSDDGGKLVINGETVAEFFGNRGNTDSIGVPVFLGAGNHEIEFVWYEQGGGASGEAYYRQGIAGQFSDGGFVLVGDPAQGINTSNMVTTTYDVQIPNTGDINNIAAALNLLNGTTPATTWSYFANVINMRDTGGEGNFGNNDPFLFMEGTDRDDFVMVASAFIEVTQAGLYQFGSNTDDGAAIQINGNVYMVDDVLAGPHNALGPQIFLTEGFHTIDFLFFERGGGAEAELFQVINGQFVLLGDVANGALRVTQQGAIPEPATAVLGLLGMGLLGMRRKRIA